MGCVQCRLLAAVWPVVTRLPSSPGYPLPDTVTSDPSSGRCLGGVLISIDPKHASSLPSSDLLSSWPPSGWTQDRKLSHLVPSSRYWGEWCRQESASVIGDVTFLYLSWTPVFHQPACLPAYTPLLGDSDNSVCTVWVVKWCQWCGEAERRILIMKWGRQFSALHVFSFLICCFAPVPRSIQYSLCISSAQPPPPTTCGWLCTEQSVHTLTTVPCIKMNFRYKNSAIAMASFYDLAAKRLDGEMIKMEQYRGKVVLVENTASLWGTTVRDFTQMNELCEKVWWNDSIYPYSKKIDPLI